ncbi:hypothetical protein JQK15_25670 [Sphingobium sp. BHU LFT2]|uniref:hypothetical protein n=1 Tax=Sphingobium sp. BHU LFT2 TaxID=2807634 RepID=UPI001BE70657|nr:hypothetical protein [Sphingobium sp. BHU LFT2]MBT2246889.1 hypothetical protein [Sphingobium sp. BHU LFT2]
MKNISEDALVPFCLGNLPADLRYAILASDADRLEAVRSLLTEHLLEASLLDPGIVREGREVSARFATDLASRVGRVSEDGKTVKLYTFGFKDAGKATALQLLGLGLALFLAPPTPAQGVQALAIIKSLWEKLLVLKRPEHGDAIDMMEAIGRLRAVNLSEGNEAMPATAELLANVDMSEAQGNAALKWLESKKLIEVTAWGGQAGDVAHAQTSWRICL